MARKPRAEHPPRLRDGARVSAFTVFTTCILLALAALAERVSLLALTPIYGSIPASTYHSTIPILAASIAGGLSVFQLSPSVNVLKLALPMHASTTPALLYYALVPASSDLGPRIGPVLTEACTLLPILVMSFCVGVSLNDKVQAKQTKGGEVLLLLLLFVIYYAFGGILDAWLMPLVGRTMWTSRWALEVFVSSAYVGLFPSKLLFLSLVPALSFLSQTSPHGPLPGNLRKLKRNLQAEGYGLLARRESVTGYLSVLQNERDQFRVLRCDHSLLGGVWLPTEARAQQGITMMEPVFPIFTMLEAVRLMVDATTESDVHSPKNALVIGLGVGTCPAALQAHGVNVTTLELDPAVTELATSFFDFDVDGKTSSVVHGDAVRTVAALVKSGRKFDYIVHDVFTGGAEPIPLFEAELLEALRSLLSPSGNIAVNYAGDLTLPTTSLVVDTIFQTFEDCRLFRDEAKKADATSDFANFVAFCKAGDWNFREVTEADFLKSQARRHWMVPTHEIDVDRLPRLDGERKLLDAGTTKILEQTQASSARNHWRIMRGVIPKGVWLNW